MRKYGQANSPQGERKASFTSKNEPFIQKRATLNKKNPNLPETVQTKAEQSLGGDFSGVDIHKNSEKAKDANASAVTQGENIHFAPGKFAPDTEKGQELIGHELTHIQQQRQGRVAPTGNYNNQAINTDKTLEQEAKTGGRNVAKGEISDHPIQRTSNNQTSENVAQFEDFYTARTNRMVRIHSTPTPENASSSENSTDAEQFYFNEHQDLSLIDSSGDFIQVRGTAYSNGIPVGQRDGWIYRSDTNLTPEAESSQENLQAAQDLDDMLDQHILPAFNTWEMALRVQGNAYLDSYRMIEAIFAEMNRDAKEQADMVAAILTVVCVGPLGFIGDLAANAEPFANLMFMKNEPLRGALEDAIQTGIGEGIDIDQGRWFTNRAHSEMHPTEYLNNQILHLLDLKGTVIERIGATKATIRRHHEPVDRAGMLANLYNWWNDSYLAHMPSTTSSDRAPMALEFERAFWGRYILNAQVVDEDRHLNVYNSNSDDNHDGKIQHRSYRAVPGAMQRRFDDPSMNITQSAGIERWYEMYRYARTDDPVDQDAEIIEGSPSTQKLATWARAYVPRTFD